MDPGFRVQGLGLMLRDDVFLGFGLMLQSSGLIRLRDDGLGFRDDGLGFGCRV